MPLVELWMETSFLQTLVGLAFSNSYLIPHPWELNRILGNLHPSILTWERLLGNILTLRCPHTSGLTFTYP